MGGKKKPTLSQIAKRQEKQQQAKPAAPKAKKGGEEKQVKVSIVDQKLLGEIEKDVTKWEYVTPYLVSAKYGIKVSMAAQILRILRTKGILQLYSKGHRIEVYVPPQRLQELSKHEIKP